MYFSLAPTYLSTSIQIYSCNDFQNRYHVTGCHLTECLVGNSKRKQLVQPVESTIEQLKMSCQFYACNVLFNVQCGRLIRAHIFFSNNNKPFATKNWQQCNAKPWADCSKMDLAMEKTLNPSYGIELFLWPW